MENWSIASQRSSKNRLTGSMLDILDGGEITYAGLVPTLRPQVSAKCLTYGAAHLPRSSEHVSVLVNLTEGFSPRLASGLRFAVPRPLIQLPTVKVVQYVFHAAVVLPTMKDGQSSTGFGHHYLWNGATFTTTDNAKTSFPCSFEAGRSQTPRVITTNEPARLSLASIVYRHRLIHCFWWEPQPADLGCYSLIFPYFQRSSTP